MWPFWLHTESFGPLKEANNFDFASAHAAELESKQSVDK